MSVSGCFNVLRTEYVSITFTVYVLAQLSLLKRVLKFFSHPLFLSSSFRASPTAALRDAHICALALSS